MKLLIDECAPKSLKLSLLAFGYDCATVREAGFSGKKNGELLLLAEPTFDVLVTLDKSIRYQQNLAGRKLALVVLTGTTKWSRVRLHLQRIAAVVDAATPGSYTEIDIPFSTQSK